MGGMGVILTCQDTILRTRKKVRVPPIKTQGIKTKLVPFILTTIGFRKYGKWVEPFVGSGVVLFNSTPKHALVGEKNPHIINFYKAIQTGSISARTVRNFLTTEGEKLAKHGADYYYEVRDRFNESFEPLDFLFLNRAGFNGLIRFNSKGRYNVPFCHKPNRFSKAYVTKITNQVAWVESMLRDCREWVIREADWQDTVQHVKKNDFLYLDPPYSGRHTNYYDIWTHSDLKDLAEFLAGVECKFGLSLWYENRYRKNDDIELLFGEFTVKKHEHFYHVGSTENLRNSVTEALITNF